MKSKIIIALILASLCAVSLSSCGTVENIGETSSPAVSGFSSEADDSLEKISETTENKTEAETTKASTESTTEKATESNTSAEEEVQQEVPDEYEQNDNDYNYEPEPDNVDAPDPAPAETPAEPQVQQPAVGSFSNSDLSFSGGSLLGDASGLISSLGAASSVEEAAGCLSNGADMKIYHYPGVDVSCYINGGSEIIYDIYITGGYFTPKGITVGSSRTDVVAAYGEGIDYGSFVVYGSDSYGLYIYYSGDSVTAIDYYAEV